MPASRVILLTLGDPTRRTGGYLYNARMLAALQERRLPGDVNQIALPESAGPEEIRRAIAGRCPEVLIVDSIAFEQVYPLLAWLNDQGVRVVALTHMLPSSQASDAERVRRVERAFLRRVDGAIAVSPDLARQLVEAGAAPERVRVVPPGRDGVPVLRRRPGPPGLTRFLVVANWTPNKGIHHVVEAFAGVRESGRLARLDLVGEPGSGAYAEKVRELIANRGLEAEVQVWGTLPPEKLAERYADADVFVLPTQSEGFGIVFAEALSHGLPVIASWVGPIPSLVPARCGILVSPDDVDELQAAMTRLAEAPRLRRQMGSRARRWSRHLPSWTESEQEFCKIVEDTFKQRPRSSHGNHRRGETESVSVVRAYAESDAGRL